MAADLHRESAHAANRQRATGQSHTSAANLSMLERLAGRSRSGGANGDSGDDVDANPTLTHYLQLRQNKHSMEVLRRDQRQEQRETDERDKVIN